jgi:hypothetical protein
MSGTVKSLNWSLVFFSTGTWQSSSLCTMISHEIDFAVVKRSGAS